MGLLEEASNLLAELDAATDPGSVASAHPWAAWQEQAERLLTGAEKEPNQDTFRVVGAAVSAIAAGQVRVGERAIAHTLLARARRVFANDVLGPELEAGSRDPEKFAQAVGACWLRSKGRTREADALAEDLELRGGHAALLELAHVLPFALPPTLTTVNGIGVGFGERSDERPDGSYVATYALKVIFPIAPLGRYRVREVESKSFLSEERFVILRRLALVPTERWAGVGLAIAILFPLVLYLGITGVNSYLTKRGRAEGQMRTASLRDSTLQYRIGGREFFILQTAAWQQLDGGGLRVTGPSTVGSPAFQFDTISEAIDTGAGHGTGTLDVAERAIFVESLAEAFGVEAELPFQFGASRSPRSLEWTMEQLAGNPLLRVDVPEVGVRGLVVHLNPVAREVGIGQPVPEESYRGPTAYPDPWFGNLAGWAWLGGADLPARK